MLNSKIYEVYSNYLVINLFFSSLSEYFFSKDVFNYYNIWFIINIILFSALVFLPYYKLNRNIKEGELYERRLFL